MTFAIFVQHILSLINQVVVPLIFALAFLTFVWGIFNYFFLGSDDASKQEKARSFILYGLLGMVILFSVWGLVSILLNTFGLT